MLIVAFNFGEFRVDAKAGKENDLFLRVKYQDLPQNVFLHEGFLNLLRKQ